MLVGLSVDLLVLKLVVCLVDKRVLMSVVWLALLMVDLLVVLMALTKVVSKDKLLVASMADLLVL